MKLLSTVFLLSLMMFKCRSSEERIRRNRKLLRDQSSAIDNFMYDGGKIEIILFYGRRRYTKIQMPYLLQNRKGSDRLSIVSKVHVMLNTNVTEDINYIQTAASRHPDYFVSKIIFPYRFLT